jgi:hypothetical protein
LRLHHSEHRLIRRVLITGQQSVCVFPPACGLHARDREMLPLCGLPARARGRFRTLRRWLSRRRWTTSPQCERGWASCDALLAPVAARSAGVPHCEQKRFPGARSLPQARQVRVVAIVRAAGWSGVQVNIEARRTGAQCRRLTALVPTRRLSCVHPDQSAITSEDSRAAPG